MGVLRAVVRPPANREARAKVEALREKIAEVKALGLAGRVAEATKKARPLVAEARGIGYEPLLAEALDALGRIERWTGPFPEAEAELDEPMLVAEGSRHDRVLAEAAVDEIMLFSALGRVDDLNRLVPRGEVTLKRIGGDPLLESWIYTAIGVAMSQNGKHADSLAMDRKALETKKLALSEDHWDVALSRGNIAEELHSLGRDKEALEENERAVGVLERALGRRHPDLAGHIYNRGEIRLALGQITEARADFERSLSIWTEELPPDHIYNSLPLTGIGLAILAEGKSVREAIDPLERAFKIRESAPAEPKMRAETMFALARALWEAGPNITRDHKRAVGLAESARDMFPADEDAERRKVEGALALWRETKGTASAPGSAGLLKRSLRP